MNRFVLNETSYHGAGAIQAIPGEVKKRGLKKAFVCSDPDLVKFKVTDKVARRARKGGNSLYVIFRHQTQSHDRKRSVGRCGVQGKRRRLHNSHRRRLFDGYRQGNRHNNCQPRARGRKKPRRRGRHKKSLRSHNRPYPPRQARRRKLP